MADSFSDAAGALAWARTALAGADAEPLDAPILLAHVLGADRAALLAHPERPLTGAQRARFRALTVRRAAGEPVAYLTGRRAFYDMALRVSPDVLIPRPETEHLVEAALAWASGRRALVVADVGTGSGAIALALAAHLPDSEVWALDSSPGALAVARANAQEYDWGQRIRFAQGDLLQPLIAAGARADLIAANLPYIPSGEVDVLPVARYEPRRALDGGPDGLALIRRLLDQAPCALAPGGLLLLEIGAGQGAAVHELARAALPDARVRLLTDYAGHERVASIERGR